MKFFIFAMVALLIVVHQDEWFWDDPTLVAGFLPVGLFYHACISLAAGLVWFMATLFIWPRDEEILASIDGTSVESDGDAKQADASEAR